MLIFNTLSALYLDRTGFGQLCSRIPKTTPYPSCTGTNSVAEDQHLNRCLRRVTPTNATAGPLCTIFQYRFDFQFYPLDNNSTNMILIQN